MKKLKKEADVAKFLIAIKSCLDDVFYESSEGDVLNLASTLSQYVFCSIAAQPEFLENGIIRCNAEEDYEKLADFFEED